MIILRLFSYLYHLLLGLVLFLLGLIPAVAGGELNLGMVPWIGKSPGWLMLAGIAGSLFALLAAIGRLRLLFLLWALLAVAGIFLGYFWSTYQFSGPDEFNWAMWIFVGSLVALAGALSAVFKRRKRTLEDRKRERRAGVKH